MSTRAPSDLSGCEMPIFITRLVVDSGWIMNGEVAHLGSRGVIELSRSWMSNRAFIRSTPWLKIMTMEESWVTDLDRITARPGMPFISFSIGTVTSSSTSRADRPVHSVCTSTWGGANSGKASIGMWRICRMPKNISIDAPTTTSTRSFRLVAMIQRIMVAARLECPVWTWLFPADPDFGAVELDRADRHNGGARRWAAGQECLISVGAGD